MKTKTGFVEIVHTADWAVRVWAPDLAGLFSTAADALYALTDTQLDRTADFVPQSISIGGSDTEDLLVAFLSELLYLAEALKLGCPEIQLQVVGFEVKAELKCWPILRQAKEIKAVTYHHLAICENSEGLETTIVFDV